MLHSVVRGRTVRGKWGRSRVQEDLLILHNEICRGKVQQRCVGGEVAHCGAGGPGGVSRL